MRISWVLDIDDQWPHGIMIVKSLYHAFIPASLVLIVSFITNWFSWLEYIVQFNFRSNKYIISYTIASILR